MATMKEIAELAGVSRGTVDRVINNRGKVRKELARNDVDVIVDNRSEKIGFKIREAQLEKIPYMLVIGEKEMAAGAVAVRSRKEGDKGAISVDEFTSHILKEIAEKTLNI